MHELLGRDDPTRRNRREESVTLARSKILGAVVSGIDVYEIFLLLGIGNTSHIADVSGWDITVV